MPKKALFWKKLDGKKKILQCQLCPHYCSLKSDELGKCKVRQNKDGELVSLSYAKPCAINLDNIEKKPLYHFLPRTESLSVGMPGCNLRCSHCQNWRISQHGPDEVPTSKTPPKKIVDRALKTNSPSISYTYTEPLVSYEMVLETAKLAREKGIKNVLVSNGFINQEPLKKLLPYLDAANIDFKAMSDKHYREVCGGRLEPVLETIKTMKDKGVWIELTNLLIPELNDSKQDIGKLVDWVKENVGEEVPIHFSGFYPVYKMKNREPTSIEKLREARKIVKDKGMNYVYIGNLPDQEGSNTYCPQCGEAVIKRGRMTVEENKLQEGKCPQCGEKIAGVWC